MEVDADIATSHIAASAASVIAVLVAAAFQLYYSYKAAVKPSYWMLIPFLLSVLLFWPVHEVILKLYDVIDAINTMVLYPSKVLVDIKATAISCSVLAEVEQSTEAYELPVLDEIAIDLDPGYAAAGSILGLTTLLLVSKLKLPPLTYFLSPLLYLAAIVFFILAMAAAAVLKTACVHVSDLEASNPEVLFLFKDTTTDHPFLQPLLDSTCVTVNTPLDKHLTPGILSSERDTIDSLCDDVPPYLYFAAALFLLIPLSFFGAAVFYRLTEV